MQRQPDTKSFWGIICISGVPWLLILTVFGILIKKWWYTEYRRQIYTIKTISDIKGILAVSTALWMIVILRNLMWIGSNRRVGLFTWMTKYREEPQPESHRNGAAQYPLVSKEYLSDEPNQFPLAKQGKKYVQFNIDSCLSLLLFGSPGAGKTTLLLTMIIYQLYRVVPRGELKPAMFIYDFKQGEIYRKSCKPNNPNVMFVSLEGRSYYGWDLYYRLKPDSSDDDVIRELTLIVNVVIDGSNEKNAFFSDSAKIIFVFVGLYDFRVGKSFLQTIDHITGGDTKTMLKQVVERCEGKPEFKKVYDALVEFVVTDDKNEALSNIKMTLKQRMSVFKVEDVRWALEYNPRKASPYKLESGKTIFMYPGDTAVTDVVLKIIAKQLEYHCRHRDYMNLEGGGDLRKIYVVADECYSIGKVVDWAGWASVARGFKTTLLMVWQSYSQIKEIYGTNMAESLMDDVAGIAVLAVNSPQNAEQFVAFAGEYLEENRTYSSVKSEESYSRSYERRQILEKKDFLSLRKDNEAILLMDGNYYRVKSEAARYYNIPEIKQISDKCMLAQQAFEKKRTRRT